MHESLELILSLVHAGIIDRVQLHAPMTHEEAEVQMAAIRAAVDVPIIRAFGMPATGTNVILTEALASSADYCLFDNARGGSGEPFNHQVLRYYPAPYILSGGLTPETVGAAIELLSPFGVDVSSGIEVEGRKSAEKMTAFVEAVRRADQGLPPTGRWPSGAKGKDA